MRDSDLVEEIRRLDPRNAEAVKRLTERVRQDAFAGPRTLVRLIHEAKQNVAKKAKMVLLGTDELAFTPVLEAYREEPADDYVWDLQTLVDIQLENRSKIVEQLNAMLLDTRPVPLPNPPMPEEEQAPSRRVCDEAYLMLRSLLAFESEEAGFINEDAFLADMTEEERDEEIERIKSSDEWVNLVETYLK